MLWNIEQLFSFVQLIEITTGVSEPTAESSHYNIISRNTVASRIDEFYSIEKEKLIAELANVKYICATADIWSTKRKSFLGATIHYVDENTLEKKSRALCCRRFRSPHDYERITSLLSAIYEEFNISEKVICTVTDNASNFVKAFKEFGISLEAFLAFIDSNNKIENEMLENSIETPIVDENDNLDFFEDELSAVIFEEIDDNITSRFLSAHFRCGSHTLCRIAAKDANDAFSNSTQIVTKQPFLRSMNCTSEQIGRKRAKLLVIF